MFQAVWGCHLELPLGYMLHGIRLLCYIFVLGPTGLIPNMALLAFFYGSAPSRSCCQHQGSHSMMSTQGMYGSGIVVCAAASPYGATSST